MSQETTEEKARFKVKHVATFDQIREGQIVEIPTSDLCLTDEKGIYQFEYIEPEDVVKKIEVKPGIYTLIKTMGSVNLQHTELNLHKLLESVNNTSRIKNEVDVFFERLDVYEKLELPKKRAILLYSSPGYGKTSAINKAVADLISEDKGTVVFIWPTDEIEAGLITKLLSFAAEYTKECTRLILIAEDIGGGEQEGSSRPRNVDSGLLNLLDGVNVVFRLPTFIIATTNYPENLIGALANRPGRFDEMIELDPPSYDEKIQLMEFISRRKLNDEEKGALAMPGSDFLSIAHLKEIVTRTLIHNKSIAQVVKEMVQHNEKFNEGFLKKKNKGGFGLNG